MEKVFTHTNKCSLVNGGSICDCGAWSGKGQEDVSENSEQGVNATPETKVGELVTPSPLDNNLKKYVVKNEKRMG